MRVRLAEDIASQSGGRLRPEDVEVLEYELADPPTYYLVQWADRRLSQPAVFVSTVPIEEAAFR